MIDKGFKLTLAATAAALLLHAPAHASEQLAANTAPQQKAKLTDLWQPGDNGQRMNIRGRVTSVDGTPVANVAIDIRQPDGDGDAGDAAADIHALAVVAGLPEIDQFGFLLRCGIRGELFGRMYRGVQ